jgi:hypothetical protein
MSQPKVQEFLAAVPEGDWDAAIEVEFDDDRPTVVHPIMSKAKRLTEEQIIDIMLSGVETI